MTPEIENLEKVIQKWVRAPVKELNSMLRTYHIYDRQKPVEVPDKRERTGIKVHAFLFYKLKSSNPELLKEITRRIEQGRGHTISLGKELNGDYRKEQMREYAKRKYEAAYIYNNNIGEE